VKTRLEQSCVVVTIYPSEPATSLRGHLIIVTRLQDMHRDYIIPRVAFIHHGLISATNRFSTPAHGYGGHTRCGTRAIIAPCGVVRRDNHSWRKLAKACCPVPQAYLRVRLWLMMACLFHVGIWGKEFTRSNDRSRKTIGGRDVMVQRRAPLSLLARCTLHVRAGSPRDRLKLMVTASSNYRHCRGRARNRRVAQR
jgi:hypothetical protein